jgi:hypothetical protein
VAVVQSEWAVARHHQGNELSDCALGGLGDPGGAFCDRPSRAVPLLALAWFAAVQDAEVIRGEADVKIFRGAVLRPARWGGLH